MSKQQHHPQQKCRPGHSRDLRCSLGLEDHGTQRTSPPCLRAVPGQSAALVGRRRLRILRDKISFRVAIACVNCTLTTAGGDNVDSGNRLVARRRGASAATWAVQMLEVALSRRMCCSRVCMAMRNAGAPDASTLTPMMRPGISRLYSSEVAKKAA